MKAVKAVPTRVSGRFSPGSVLVGVACAFLVAFLAAGAFTLLLTATPVTERFAPAALEAAGILSIFSGGLVSGRRSGGAGWLHGGVTGLVYASACSALGAAAFPGGFGLGALARRLLVGFGAGAAGGMAGVNM